MSETTQAPTHVRGNENALHPITGEPPGIKEILERRAAGGLPDPGPDHADPATPAPDTTVVTRPDDDAAAQAAREVAGLRSRASDAEARAAEADRLRADAERRRVDAENQRATAVQNSEDTSLTAINTALAASIRERDSLQAEGKAAGEAGDFGRAMEISTQLGEIGAEIRELSRGKSALEQDRQTRINTPPRQPDPVVTHQAPVGDPTERSILAGLRAPSRQAFLDSRTPATRDFLYQHAEFFTDPAAHQRMVGAESLARGRGLAVDSPAYFEAIREASSVTQPTAAPTTVQRPVDRPSVDRTAPPAAAPSRNAPSPTGQRLAAGGDVYVSAEDKKVAEWLQVDAVEMVQERQSLEQRGEWPYRRR
jgi:hypothetical protein